MSKSRVRKQRKNDVKNKGSLNQRKAKKTRATKKTKFNAKKSWNWNFALSILKTILTIIGSLCTITTAIFGYKYIYSISADLNCLAVKDINILRGTNEDFLAIPARCRITNYGLRAFEVIEVYPIMFSSGTPLKQRSFKDIEPNYNQHRKRDFPEEALNTKSFKVGPRSTMSIDTVALVPLFFYNQESSSEFGSNKSEEMKSCILKAKDNLDQKHECFYSIIDKGIVEYLYFGAQFPMPHVGFGEINGVGVKMILFNEKQLIDEIDIREFYGWFSRNDDYILRLGNREKFDEMISR